MSTVDEPASTQRRSAAGIEVELDAEGFEGAELIGRGGFGTVYRCLERALERQVAVKVLTTGHGPDDLDRFLREQRTLGKLSGHPNIVTVLHADVTVTGRPYLVMPYHSRGSLAEILRTCGPLSLTDGLQLGVKLAGALETAHHNGILHRDVKPGNVLVTDYGEPQLCDFGIAHVSGGFETDTGVVTGSPAFTAPEVLSGRTSTAQSDIYGLGATLFTALSGHAAFERLEGEDVVAQFVRIGREGPPSVPEIPHEAAVLISAAMATRPQDRPTGAREFGETLRALQRRLGLPVDDMGLAAGVGNSVKPPIATTMSDPMAHRNHRSTSLPTPATRFRPPYPPDTLVRRPRLIELSELPARKRLTLIHAPAGFGKSSVATQLAERLHHDGVRVGWLAADIDDDNPVIFCSHLLQALSRAEPGLGAELGLVLEEAGTGAERFVLSSLINEIHERKQQIAIVIEDWHQVTGDTTRSAMRFLLDKGCHHLQWIITSRTKSGLPLGTLRVRGELVEIDSTTLRFNDDETYALLSRYDGVDIDSENAARISAAAEGWVAGLQLAALSLRHGADPAALVAELSGRHRAIGEFLTENVLDALDPALVKFMMATSFPRRVCADLANALTGGDRGQALLEDIEERNLFLRRLDEDGKWYRYYRLYADFLRQRLEREQPQRVPVLHRAAARWFAQHDMVTDAVTHAMAAGDDQWAAELVENAGIALLEQGQMARLLALTDTVPSAAAAARPRLQLLIALANVTLRKKAAARAALDHIYAMVDTPGYDAAAAASLRAHCRMVEAVAAVLADRTEGVTELITPALTHPEAFEPWYPAGAAVAASFLALARSDYAAARACRERAAGYLENAKGPFTETYAYCLSGIAAHEQLDITAAEYYLRKAHQVAMRGRSTPGVAARLAGALLAELVYERDELDEAERLLDEAFEPAPTGGTVDFMIAIYVTGAKAKAAQHNPAEAEARLDAGSRLAHDLSFPRLTASIAGERIRLGIGEVPEFATASPTIDGELSGTAELTRDIVRSNAIRRALAAPDDGPPPITEARSLVESLAGRGRQRALVTAEILLARCLWASGQHNSAKQLLSRTAARCAELGLMRLVQDEDVTPILSAIEAEPRS
ncbi:protein kinase domain-containing protein [Nocardia sp. CA-084685]|uniref:protein kinase domain-containing protein n=1 Tax=Nocardia sp. CA-084685 TaxID=3239970 RepID=UPI003D98B2CA